MGGQIGGSDGADEAIEAGLKARAAGDIDAAREAFGAAVEAGPNNTRAKFLLAETLADQGRLEEAENLYSIVLESRPDHFRALTALAELYLQRGKVAQVELLLDRARISAGNEPQRLFRVGVAFGKAGRMDEAETALSAVVANSSEGLKEKAQQALASLKHEPGERRSKVQALDAALLADPEAADIKLRLANALCKSEPEWRKRGVARFAGIGSEPSDAINRARDLSREVSRSGTPAQQAEALALLGEIARFESRWQEALDWYRQATDAQPTDPELQVEVGNALRDLSMPKEAGIAYKKALALEPKSISALLALGDLEKSQSHEEEAGDYYNRAAAIDPANLNVASALRRLQTSEGAFDWQDEIRRAIEGIKDESNAQRFVLAASVLLQYGLTDLLKPALPRLEAMPRGRQIAVAARELDRAGVSQALDAEGTGFAGPDADLNEIRGFVEKPVPGGETLVVIFSGGNRQLGGIEFSLLHRFVRRTGASAIYVRDIKESRYLQGIVGLGDDLNSTVRSLREKKKDFGAKRLMMIGTCRGAPGAMRYGLAAGADAVLGIEPNIGAPGMEKLKPVDVERVEKFRARHAQAKPLKDLYAAATKRPALTLVYSDHNEPYAGRARELGEIPGVVLVGTSNTRYPIMRTLLAANLLEPVLREFIACGSVSPELADRIRSTPDRK